MADVGLFCFGQSFKARCNESEVQASRSPPMAAIDVNVLTSAVRRNIACTLIHALPSWWWTRSLPSRMS